MDKNELFGVLLGVFKNTEDFINNLSPRQYSPPFITTIFSFIRKTVFETVKNCLTQKENMLFFLSKFELEYVETLRSKLRERYIDCIVRENYQIPEEIRMEDAKKWKAVSEMTQISIAIAEWALEIEIIAYNLEGLELYGIAEIEKKGFDYLTLVKEQYRLKSKNQLALTLSYIFRKLINYGCEKMTSLVLAKGMSKGIFQGKEILDILKLSSNSEVIWKSLFDTFDLTWTAGGLICSYFFQSLNNFIIKKEVLNNIKQIQEIIGAQKLDLINKRKILLDLADNIINEDKINKLTSKRRDLLEIIDQIIDPIKNNTNRYDKFLFLFDGNSEKFRVREEEDVILIEEKEFQEKDDDSDLIIVE